MPQAQLPDGTILEFPNGINPAVMDKAVKEHLMQSSQGVSPNAIQNSDIPQAINRNAPLQQLPQTPNTIGDYAKASLEVPTTLATGAIAAVPGMFTSPDIAQKIQEKFTYQPRNHLSQDVVGSIGKGIEEARLPPYLGGGIAPQLSNMSHLLKAGTNSTALLDGGVSKLVGMLRGEPKTPEMVGVGSAMANPANARADLAASLRVPVKLSKGQAERDLAQQQFEIETSKNMPEGAGKPLIHAQAARNDAILQNFDAFVDATGKESFGLGATGKVVDKALVDSANKAKTEINLAYDAAREAGEMEQPVSYAPLKKYIDNQTPTVKTKLAPLLSAVDEELAKNDPKKTGKIAINSLEDIYQFINKHYEPGTPAGLHAKEMKKLITESTDGQGGQLYQQARALRTKYSQEFENIGAVDKLLRNKPGTTDRAVAFEDVFKHSILDGSLDDVKNIGYALKKAGLDGQQAWKELQGQTIQNIKDKVTQSVDIDSMGNPVVSPAKLKSAVRELDQDGKLDYILGKKGAQEVRDLLDVTINVNAPLKGATNYSNTSSSIIRALDSISESPIGKIPALGSVLKHTSQKLAESELNKKVSESINYNQNNMAKALRKKD